MSPPFILTFICFSALLFLSHRNALGISKRKLSLVLKSCFVRKISLLWSQKQATGVLYSVLVRGSGWERLVPLSLFSPDWWCLLGLSQKSRGKCLCISCKKKKNKERKKTPAAVGNLLYNNQESGDEFWELRAQGKLVSLHEPWLDFFFFLLMVSERHTAA